MPFWDRSLDLVILTLPDAGHITGLPEVLGRYLVGGWLENGRAEDDAVYELCKNRLIRRFSGRYIDGDGSLGVSPSKPCGFLRGAARMQHLAQPGDS